MKHLLTALLILLAAQLQGQSTSYATITVEPHKSHENYEHFKRLTLETDYPEADYIDGFEFVWGYRYQLRVKVDKLGTRLSDGTGFEFSLDSVISKTAVDADFEFRLFLDPLLYYPMLDHDEDGNPVETPENPRNFKVVDEGTWLYCEEVAIEVPEKLREQFATLVSGEQGRVGHFHCVGDNRIRLIRF